MIETAVFVWWGLYIGALILQQKDERENKTANWLMLLLGYWSIAFAYIYAETGLTYALSAVVLTIVHFIYSNKVTGIVALALIFLGYVIKFS